MSGLPTGLILEVLVAVLLIVTVVYCALLDRRLRALRSGQDGLRDLIGELNRVIDQARVSIADLDRTAAVSGEQLGEQITKGRALADELSLMLEAGNRIADRLGETVSKRPSRAASSSVPPAVDPVGNMGREKPAAREVESQLLETLRRAR